MMSIIQFDSLNELQYLRLEQHSLKQVASIQNKLRLIPSLDLKMIDIQAVIITMPIVEEILEQFD
jgi:hypothetical protein